MLQYEWTKVDGPLSQNAVIRGGQLYITPVTAADAGRYRCVAITTAGTAEAFSQIIISGTATSSFTVYCYRWRKYKKKKGRNKLNFMVGRN